MAAATASINLGNHMQQITPIEIRQRSFEKSFRGYNPDEVDAFLHALAYAWEKVVKQLEETRFSLENSEGEVKRLQEMESALLKIIKNAETTARSITEQAHREAELKTRAAKLEADHLIHETHKKVKAIEEESQQEHQHLKEQMAQELAEVKKMVQEAETYRATLLGKLRHLAEDILTRSQLIESKIQPDVDHNGN